MSQVLKQLSPPSSADAGTEVLSYYRIYAGKCQTAADNSPNARQQAELEKMVQVWRDFADLHERMMREAGNVSAVRRRIRGWM